MRPNELSLILGQEHLTGPKGILSDATNLPSLILWGAPGCGKTTIARALANRSNALFLSISAVLDGVKELRSVIERAKAAAELEQRSTILFIDEIHRWNKAQQDALLPHVEAGTITLIGATTENPSFHVIPALRSRAEVVGLNKLTDEAVAVLLNRALADKDDGLAALEVSVDEEVLMRIAALSCGDVRRALTLLERLCTGVETGGLVTEEIAKESLKRADIHYDRDGEEHFNTVSALIKSMRGSDPDAAVYWLARMLHGGDDPVFIARRLVIFASEDIGNADPRALLIATSTASAVQLVGLPECRINLSQAVIYLASAPKSNASYNAINKALSEVKKTGALPVPLHLRNPVSKDMKKAGYGVNYKYPHDYEHGFVHQQHLPDQLPKPEFYKPVPWGHEKSILERLKWWKKGQ
jgi:putative ATPase